MVCLRERDPPPPHTALGSHNIAQKFIRCLALTFRILANKMVEPSAAAVERYEVESGDGL